MVFTPYRGESHITWSMSRNKEIIRTETKKEKNINLLFQFIFLKYYYVLDTLELELQVIIHQGVLEFELMFSVIAASALNLWAVSLDPFSLKRLVFILFWVWFLGLCSATTFMYHTLESRYFLNMHFLNNCLILLGYFHFYLVLTVEW